MDIDTEIRIRNIPRDLRAELIEILITFADRNIAWALQEQEYTHAMAGLCELRRIYSGLATVYPEFMAHLRRLDAGLDRLQVVGRTRLLQQYLRSQDLEEIQSISETLGAVIAAGKWPDWQLDFDRAIEERCQSPSIVPVLKAVS
jgi:hypothetical protein